MASSGSPRDAAGTVVADVTLVRSVVVALFAVGLVPRLPLARETNRLRVGEPSSTTFERAPPLLTSSPSATELHQLFAPCLKKPVFGLTASAPVTSLMVGSSRVPPRR